MPYIIDWRWSSEPQKAAAPSRGEKGGNGHRPATSTEGDNV
jgi:hypothetical protein